MISASATHHIVSILKKKVKGPINSYLSSSRENLDLITDITGVSAADNICLTKQVCSINDVARTTSSVNSVQFMNQCLNYHREHEHWSRWKNCSYSIRQLSHQYLTACQQVSTQICLLLAYRYRTWNMFLHCVCFCCFKTFFAFFGGHC